MLETGPDRVHCYVHWTTGKSTSRRVLRFTGGPATFPSSNVEPASPLTLSTQALRLAACSGCSTVSKGKSPLIRSDNASIGLLAESAVSEGAGDAAGVSALLGTSAVGVASGGTSVATPLAAKPSCFATQKLASSATVICGGKRKHRVGSCNRRGKAKARRSAHQ